MKLHCLFFCLILAFQAKPQSAGIYSFEFADVSDTKDCFHYTGNNEPIISGHHGGATVHYPENAIATLGHTNRRTIMKI